MRVTRSDLEFFRRDLWKDERKFERVFVHDGEFDKYCFTEGAARREALVLEHLSTAEGEQLAPRVLRVEGPHLVMERVDGIRMFDLLRYLRALELDRRDGVAARVWTLLINRCRMRLAKIQTVLLANYVDFASGGTYPMQAKLVGLLGLFQDVLELPPQLAWERDLRAFVDYWDANASLIPFRDATTKNMLVEVPELSVDLNLEPSERMGVLAALLDRESEEYWSLLSIRDFDFSSVEHMTSPEDDPISLHCHEWTYGSCTLAPEAFVLLPSNFMPDSYRCAASLMVRFLRFGGRKLAYKLLNSQGFEVRFEYDNPLFYFRTVKGACAQLSPLFVKEHADLLDMIQLIGDTVSGFSAADEAQLRVDHFRRVFGESADYWQENPIERSSR